MNAKVYGKAGCIHRRHLRERLLMKKHVRARLLLVTNLSSLAGLANSLSFQRITGQPGHTTTPGSE